MGEGLLRGGLSHSYVPRLGDPIKSGQKCPVKLSNGGRGGEIRGGEKRGFGIPARIGDRTKRSQAGSGSGGAAGGSMRGIAGLLRSVSLFCWKRGCDDCSTAASGRGMWFESLFCWMGRCDPTPFVPGSRSPHGAILDSWGHSREPQAHILSLRSHQSLRYLLEPPGPRQGAR